MKIEVIGFGKPFGNRITSLLQKSFPRSKVLHVHGKLKKSNVVIELSKKEHLVKVLKVFALTEKLLLASGEFHIKPAKISITRSFRRRLRRVVNNKEK